MNYEVQHTRCLLHRQVSGVIGNNLQLGLREGVRLIHARLTQLSHSHGSIEPSHTFVVLDIFLPHTIDRTRLSTVITSFPHGQRLGGELSPPMTAHLPPRRKRIRFHTCHMKAKVRKTYPKVMGRVRSLGGSSRVRVIYTPKMETHIATNSTTRGKIIPFSYLLTQDTKDEVPHRERSTWEVLNPYIRPATTIAIGMDLSPITT